MARTDRRRTNTRARIQAVALELFATNGYDNTSLRSIADELGVTKAAVYYHFPAKEDIVRAAAADLRLAADDLIKWAQQADPGPDRAVQILSRYSDVLHRFGAPITRLWAQNNATFQHLGIGTDLRHQFRLLGRLIAEPDDRPVAEFRARQALLAISWSITMTGDLTMTDDQKHAAATSIALAVNSLAL